MAALMMEPDTSNPADDIATALKAMKKSCPGYDRAEQYYEGDVPEVFASARLRRALRRSGINFQLDFAATVVDSVVDRLELASVTADVENDDSADDSEDETADTSPLDDVIQAIYEANKMDLQATNVMRKACTFGDAYVIVWPRENATSVNGRYKPEDLALYYQDPRTMRVFYSADDPNKVEFAAKKWLNDAGFTRLDLYYADRVESYVSKKKNATGLKATDFEPTTGADRGDSDQDREDDNPAHIEPHDFGQVPVFHFKTDADQYGVPEHRRFYAVSDILHKLVIGHMAGVDFQAYPQRWAILDPDEDTSEAARLDEGLFSYEMEQGGTTEQYGTEARAQMKADPGSLWMMRGIKQFGQFDVADAANFTDPAEFYLRAGATITNTPLHYFDPSGDQPSGESLKTAEAPFVKKVKTRKLSFGDTWRELFEFCLRLCGYPDTAVLVRWAPSESTDDQATWTTAKLKQEAGVPTEQTLLEGGYTAQQVEEWEKKGEANLPQKMALMLQIGEAVASFATGVTAGVITREQVNAIITNLIGDIANDSTDNGEPAKPEPVAPEPTQQRPAASSAA